MKQIPLKSLSLEADLQPRSSIDVDHWQGMAEWLRENPKDDLPTIEVCLEGAGKYWAWDGFHRVLAYQNADRKTIPANVRPGTKRDAILLSFGANATHGLKRSNEDKRRAVLTALADEEWSKWSDRDIAKCCNVGHPLVSQIRRERSASGSSSTYQESKETQGTVKYTRGGKVQTQRVTRKGTSPKPPKKQPEPPTEDVDPEIPEPEEAITERGQAVVKDRAKANFETLATAFRTLVREMREPLFTSIHAELKAMEAAVSALREAIA